MKRWLPWLLLVLSLGLNVGFFGALGLRKLREARESSETSEALKTRSGAAEQSESGAQNLAPGAAVRPAQRITRVADHLGLTGGARQGFIAVQHRFLREIQSRRQELERLQSHLQREILAEDPAPSLIERDLEEIGRAYADLDAAFVHNILSSREFLDDDQERQFLELLSRLRAQTNYPGHR